MNKRFALKPTAAAVVALGSVLALAGWTDTRTVETGSWQQACPSSGEMSASLSGALAHVRFLADDALTGREVGSEGAYCAGDYIAAQFEEIGLVPMGDDETFFQHFPIRAGAELTGINILRTPEGDLRLDEEWRPYGFSASSSLDAETIYGADGINRPERADNPYPGLDLDGKIVVLEYGDPESPNRVPLNAQSHFKATVAQGRDAAAVVILMPEGTSLPPLDAETRAFLRIPVVAVSGRAAGSVRAAARDGATLAMSVGVEARRVQARNVVALLPGSDPAYQHDMIIIGAHYDHLGIGGEGSLNPNAYGQVHNGADDNASGTAALIEVARKLKDRNPTRTVLFIAFTGEEKGLWGANHFVANPTFPLSGAVAMLNMDMVGRLEDRSMTIFGVGTADEWEDILAASNGRIDQPVTYATAPDGYGPSDHAAFYGAGMPVLHFFTGTHLDYHRPTDDWEKVDGPGLERIVNLVTEVTMEVAGAPGAETLVTMEYVEGAGTPMPVSSPTSDEEEGDDSAAASTSGYGEAYLGSIPDMTPIDFGLRLSGVREGGPADLGGMQRGDIVVAWNGKEIADIYAYTYALREHEPGDTVEITVLRDGERVTLSVTLGRR